MAFKRTTSSPNNNGSGFLVEIDETIKKNFNENANKRIFTGLSAIESERTNLTPV
jgi:hypothetical protein